VKTAAFSSVLGVLILLFSFQNCQNSQPSDEINEKALNSVGVAANSIDLNQEAMERVDFIIPASKVVSQANHTYQINYNKILKIDIKTGAILESSDLDATTATYCLSESLKNKLMSILNSSQICKASPNLPAGTMCSQVMRPPYAQLLTNREQYDLGSATDSCGNNSVDLCGDQANLLKIYIENFKNQYKQLLCP